MKIMVLEDVQTANKSLRETVSRAQCN